MADFKSTKIKSSTGEDKGLLFYGNEISIVGKTYPEAISEGIVSGIEVVNIIGRASAIGTSTIDVTTIGGTYVFPTVAQQMNVRSSSAQDKGTPTVGTGIQKIYIFGLDGDFNEINEEVTLDGTSDVVTVNSYYRINSVVASACGTSGAAVGNITIKDTGNTTTYAKIDIGLTLDRQIIYTVPAGKELFVTSIRVAAGKTNTTNFTTFTFKTTYNGITTTDFFLPVGEVSVFNAGFYELLDFPAKFPAGTDLKVSVVNDAANAIVATASVRGWLKSI